MGTRLRAAGLAVAPLVCVSRASWPQWSLGLSFRLR
jgi:hypothetical protein